MAANDDRFRLMFYEEARELLIGLEEGLVELERRQGDRAHLDQTFRAAHSIKGAAGMVGLGTIAEFTHGLEAVLDRIRAGKLAVDSDIITTLLEAKDHLAAMVEGEAAGLPVAASSELNQRLSSLIRDSGQPTPSANPPPAPSVADPPPAPEPTDPDLAAMPSARNRKPVPRGSAEKAKANPRPRAKKAHENVPSEPTEHPVLAHYRITLKPGRDTLRRGVNPLGVLDELRELGEARVSTDSDLVPPLDEIDPERCYLIWVIDLKTNEPADRLDDVFLFVAEDSTVSIERQTADGSLQAQPPPPTLAITPATASPETRRAPRNPPVPVPPPPGSGSRPVETKPAPERTATALPTNLNGHRTSARIRVDAFQLDDLVGLAGELAVLSDNLQGLRERPDALPWIHTLESLERVSRQIRDTTLDLRMVPVDELFSRFPRVVRDLADRSGKEIELRIIGQETRLDRTIIERLSEPMIHLIRNGVDHALETPQERQAAGKPRAGRITLTAGHEGDRVMIRVTDDGRGLDRDRIVRKGIKQGLVPVGTSPDDPRVDTLIFEPGFSTRDQVSELSGRGVGLDVVRDAVRGLRGSIAVESTPGAGTSFIFRLPLTLALIDGLLVETAGSRYVVPLAQVEECVSLNGSKPALAQGRPCVTVRGELVPMVPLRKLFLASGEPPARQELLLTRHAGQRVGVSVDRLLGRVQAVIQALGEGLVGINRFSGATILGDGSVSLILDLAALVTESRTADNPTTPPAGGRAEGFS
ncbi:chemotaxis protein CheA [Singulisphaera acidiphila]|uniref:Chemotaxis protein CheA n=1 Tax=Singulisphaera acidiphila (strain ATCC BAA-1392 / DSM 18658 / VKM B-2454 / MOB10) TaxID=886293 RepID=L0D8M1_SINAD|nr:chemotaxis protein CheA [Singulisphaera acidiphila]AGA25183.1 chemotaxis protein histidine kinase-like protein [Singulisphaera acidiphila DSM 18658]